MFARAKVDPKALERVEALVRSRFSVDDAALVLVTEEPGEGGPMTTILFWQDGQRRRVRVFKPVADVLADDLPAGWLAGALNDDGDVDCC